MKSVETAAFGGSKIPLVSCQFGFFSCEDFAFGALYDRCAPSYRGFSNLPLSPKKPFGYQYRSDSDAVVQVGNGDPEAEARLRAKA